MKEKRESFPEIGYTSPGNEAQLRKQLCSRAEEKKVN